MEYEWVFSSEGVDWNELSDLYRVAPLGDKTPEALQLCFSNSRYVCLVYEQGRLVGAGRALADGVDCSYIADVAVRPEYQGGGIGSGIVSRLVEVSAGHRKIILYSVPGNEGFYRKFGFRKMNTAMAIFEDGEVATSRGLIGE